MAFLRGCVHIIHTYTLHNVFTQVYYFNKTFVSINCIKNMFLSTFLLSDYLNTTFEKLLTQVYWVISNCIIFSYGFVEICSLSFFLSLSLFFFFFFCGLLQGQASLVSQMVNYPFACNAGEAGSIPGSGKSPGKAHGNPLQYSSWRIPWTEEPAGLQSMRSRTVGHN